MAGDNIQNHSEQKFTQEDYEYFTTNHGPNLA
jgi:hypothetical protein